MWLMTKHGLYSVVQKRQGVYHIRAREMGDLAALTGIDGPLPGEEIRHFETADYPYRLIVGKVEVMRLLEFLGETLDYCNFKGEIDQNEGQRRKRGLYHRIWRILLDGLGGYGIEPPRGEPSGRGPLAPHQQERFLWE